MDFYYVSATPLCSGLQGGAMWNNTWDYIGIYNAPSLLAAQQAVAAAAPRGVLPIYAPDDGSGCWLKML
jgi:hypothetical protein